MASRWIAIDKAKRLIAILVIGTAKWTRRDRGRGRYSDRGRFATLDWGVSLAWSFEYKPHLELRPRGAAQVHGPEVQARGDFAKLIAHVIPY